MKVEKEYIKNVEKLIPCPEIALEVLTTAHDAECNIPRLSKEIEKDPNLTANMLRIANSAFFGHMKKITSITDIVVRLGMETVKMIAITSASVGLLKSPQKAYNLEPGALWRHSYATAILASIIGRYAKVRDNSAVYTAGLLHDVGKVILNRPLQMEIFNREEPEEGIPLIEFERSMLYTDHAKVGMALLQDWGLPDKVTLPVGHHHECDKTKKQRTPCLIINHASNIVEGMGFHSIDQKNFFFNIQDYTDQEEDLSDIPHFHENMEKIVAEFFEKYNETSTIFFDLSD